MYKKHSPEMLPSMQWGKAYVDLVGTYDAAGKYTMVQCDPTDPDTKTMAAVADGGTQKPRVCGICQRPWINGKCSGGFMNHTEAK